MFVSVFNFTPEGANKYSTAETFAVFFQHMSIYASLLLLIVFLVTILLVRLNTTGLKFQTTFNIIKYINVSIMTLIFFLIFFKFVIYLWNFGKYASFSSNYAFVAVEFNLLLNSPIINLNSSIFSDVILLLAFSSGTVCIYLLGEKNVVKYLSNISVFAIFLVAIIFMVYTTNLLVMFIGFECLFLPTLYFVYSHGYVQRVDKTLRILLYWTLFGAFLVLSSLAYIFYKYKSLNFFYLNSVDFSYYENIILYITIFLGFGVKVPVFPFHYWLTKIHVEAPAGFSIFLSGFLVKAAIFCFYYFNLVFETEFSTQLASLVALLGIIESSFKMWTQTDFKKLIAFATIQEMNLILYLLINYQSTLDYSLVLFILIHGWLSTLMFFLVDVIQKKTSTRNIVELSGLAYNFPEIKKLIWIIILLFSGFPLTVKFVIEWAILGSFILNSEYLFIFTFFVIVVVGVTGFAKQMIIILYGMPRERSTINHVISKRDKYLFYWILSILVLLSILNFFLG